MDIVCPACGKRNGVENTSCSRCACGLEELAVILRLAAEYCRQAAVCLRSADGVGALAKARDSWNLRPSGEAARLAFLASLLNHDFAAATHWYQKAGMER